MPATIPLDQYLAGLRAQAPGTPGLAFVDLDRTLVAGYTMSAFVFEQFRRGLLDPRQVARQGLNYVRYGRQGIDFAELVGQAAADFAGMPVRDVERFADEVFATHVEPRVFREARELLAAHRSLGHEPVMVTSATQFQAGPVARALGIRRVCSTRLETRAGRLTGRVAGRPCFGTGKAIAGRAVARGLRVPLQQCWFYTDSADDLPLLQAVGRPVAVNAQPALRAQALAAGWPQLAFTSRAEPSVGGAMRTGLACQAMLAAAAAGGAAWLASRSPSEARNSMARVLGELGTAMAGLDLEVRGESHLRAARPAVFVFNHQSYVDALVLLRLLRHDLAAFCKRELADTPVLGQFMRASGAIFVDREDGAAAVDSFRQGVAALREGRSVAVAPEGTRSADGSLLPFRPGAFLMARKAGVPVVPLVLHNTAEAMPRGSLTIRPATVRVTVLPPLAPGDWGARDVGARVQALEGRYREVLAG